MIFEQLGKGIFGASIAVFSFLYGCISEMIIVLAILILFDYITGVLVAKKDKTFNYNKGCWGAIKKLSYLMIITTGYLTDITINSFASIIGINFNTYGALGFCVIFYLIGNEGISLFENWSKLGLPVPGFLNNIFNNFKSLSNTISKKNIPKIEDTEEKGGD
jgi:toxin secretion/phage lysis holin